MGISLVAKDNRLIIGSRGQAELLKSGKASNPAGGEVRKLLANGYMNVILDFDKLVEALPLDPRELGKDEQVALLGLGMLDKFSLQSTEEDGLYEVTLALSLKDKETNFFKQLATFVGNLANPAWLHIELRPRIVAAEKMAREKPNHFRDALLGSWKSEWKDEEDEGVYGFNKFNHKKDGTFSGKSLFVSKEGYGLEEHQGTWKLVGSSLVVYDETGLVDWVGGMLAASEDKLEYYGLYEDFQGYEGTKFEVSEDRRVAEDWPLPDPPEGLPTLADEVFEDGKPMEETIVEEFPAPPEEIEN